MRRAVLCFPTPALYLGERVTYTPQRTTIQTSRLSTARCALFPLPGERIKVRGNAYQTIPGTFEPDESSSGAGGFLKRLSSGRRGHQFLKLRFGLAAFKQSNRLLPAFNKRPGFAGNQQCRSRVEQNGVAFRATIVVSQ